MLLTDPVAKFNNESMCFLKLIISATLEIQIKFLLLKKNVLNTHFGDLFAFSWFCLFFAYSYF